MKTGLRTEIVVSLCLLLGAALLFAGFLLVKLTEQELLEQQRRHARAIVDMATAMLAEANPGGQEQERFYQRMFALLERRPEILGWRLVDAGLTTLAGLTTDELPPFAMPQTMPAQREMHEFLVYSSGWSPWRESTNYLDLTVPADDHGETGVLLQVRFSLENLRVRVHRAQGLIMIYVVAYGLVLTLFGIYLLNRNVVRPVRRLQQATAVVAAGSLAHVDVGRGPGEIADLAASFNRMVATLEQSRGETAAHIRSLEKTNQALQQARDDLVRSEKMASVGHLAAGMAHEIGNPLGALLGYLGLLRADLRDAAAQDLLGRAQLEAGRIDKLVRELLDYAAPGNGETECFCAVAVLRETVDMLVHQGLFDGIRIEDRCGASPALVAMDRQRLQQVWVNLLLNARDAIAANGLITLSIEISDRVEITIADQGCGLSVEVASQIFEPFFTTKDPGKGRGLGLAVCQRIVDEAGGRIEVVSSEAGAAFTVCLPRAEGEVEP